MGLNPFENKRIAARRLVVHQGEDDAVPQVYQIRRIRSEDLQAAGFAEILGPEAVQVAAQTAQQLADLERLIATAPDEQARAEREADYRAMLEAENQRAIEALTNDEERVRTLIKRCEAYLIASVEGIGLALDGAPTGILDRSVEPKDVCRELEPGLYIRKGRFVLGPDAKPDEIPLSEVPAAERIALGLMVIAALEVASAVRTFRGEPGSPRAR